MSTCLLLCALNFCENFRDKTRREEQRGGEGLKKRRRTCSDETSIEKIAARLIHFPFTFQHVGTATFLAEVAVSTVCHTLQGNIEVLLMVVTFITLGSRLRDFHCRPRIPGTASARLTIFSELFPNH